LWTDAGGARLHLVIHLLTLLMIYGLARNFTNVANSLFAAFAYLTAGYVFTQCVLHSIGPIRHGYVDGSAFSDGEWKS
jgi:hypothetical protein